MWTRARSPKLYVGVDIHPDNAYWRKLMEFDPRKTQTPMIAWGFQRIFVEANAARMVVPIRETIGKELAILEPREVAQFDLILYIDSIEQMQPHHQAASLVECGALAKQSAQLYLTCSVNRGGHIGYDTKDPAHVYEPSQVELTGWIEDAGWKVRRIIGISTSLREFRKQLTGQNLQVAESIFRTMPRQQALLTIGALYPECAIEAGFLCGRVDG